MMSDCIHPTKQPTRRTKSNGAVCVTLQCSDCGAYLGEVSKSKYELENLPVFDEEKLVNRYATRATQTYEEISERRAAQSEIWWTKYAAYLLSDRWRKIRSIVLNRDQLCQFCFLKPSDQAHHLSYKSFNAIGQSFANECVGVCSTCHENKVHADKFGEGCQ